MQQVLGLIDRESQEVVKNVLSCGEGDYKVLGSDVLYSNDQSFWREVLQRLDTESTTSPAARNLVLWVTIVTRARDYNQAG